MAFICTSLRPFTRVCVFRIVFVMVRGFNMDCPKLSRVLWEIREYIVDCRGGYRLGSWKA